MGALDMLDIGRQEVSLPAKRRELISKIADGRAVIATLMERHAAMGAKIEEATAGLRRLEEQLAAFNTVIKVLDDEGLVMAPEAVVAPTPLRAVPANAETPRPAPVARPPQERESFRPMAYMRCMTEGHLFVHSRSTSGHVTCTRCRVRRRE